MKQASGTDGATDTPRTDAEALKWGPHDGVMNVVIPADFARQLERELALAKARHQILDEREVIAFAKGNGLPKYMYDTEQGRMALARFAHAAATCPR